MNDEYRERGYLVRRGLVPQELIDELNQRFFDVADGKVDAAPGMQVARNVEVAKGLVTPETPALGISKMNFVMSDDVMKRFAEQPSLLDQVQDLIGGDLIAMNSMYLNKPPNVDGRHPLHQDLLYFPFRPADQIVGVWTALEDIPREKGCLVVVPGSHKGELREHDYPDWEHKNFLFVGIDGAQELERVHLEMKAGDTVFFHPLTIHGSGLNKTQGYRRAIAVHFANANCEDIWEGKTTFTEGVDPRLDYRLLRGSDPHGYAAEG